MTNIWFYVQCKPWFWKLGTILNLQKPKNMKWRQIKIKNGWKKNPNLKTIIANVGWYHVPIVISIYIWHISVIYPIFLSFHIFSNNSVIFRLNNFKLINKRQGDTRIIWSNSDVHCTSIFILKGPFTYLGNFMVN